MWSILIWVLGLGTIAVSILFVVMIFKNRSLRYKPLLALKYILLALSPLTLGLGRIVANTFTGRDKAMCLAILFLILSACSAYLADLKREL